MANFDPSEHPRDEEGKFTFKDGGSVLQGKLSHEEKDIPGDTYKCKLLNILKDKAAHADVLYRTPEQLEEKIKTLGGKFLEKLNWLNSREKRDLSLKTPFAKDTDKHEILRQLAIYCYDNGHQKIPEGYERLGHFYGKNNGFDAVVVKNDKKKEVVIAFRGMEQPKDAFTVGRILAKHYSSQQKDAQKTYNRIKQDPKFKDYEIYTTGTSLGGYLAQYVAAKNNLKSATFNAHQGTNITIQKEANKNKDNMRVYADNIVNYRNEKDWLSVLSTENNLGYSLETKAIIRNPNKHPVNHMAENMGDLEKARIIKNNQSKK